MPLNLPVVQRRLVDVLAHELADARRSYAGDGSRSAAGRAASRQERERHRRLVAALLLETREKSMLARWSRGGVPVFSRPHSSPRLRATRRARIDGGSPARPAGRCSGPMWIRPFRNVPVVTTSARSERVAVLSASADDAPAVRRRIRPAAPEDPGDVAARARAARASTRRRPSCPPARAATRPRGRGSGSAA